MTDWTSGYITDISYTFNYSGYLNPLWLRLPLLNLGIAPPEGRAACELGFGQGLSVNLHAAAGTCEWWATDFNPAHASVGQHLTATAGLEARLFNESFAEFCQRPDLPDFDIIGLDGVWSWITDENRTLIVDFVRRKLKPGGLLYIGYISQPGWAEAVPLQRLIAEAAETLGSPGQGIVGRLETALAFIDQLLATRPAYAEAYPRIAERLAHIKGQNRQYLAHEYLTRNFQPMHFADTVRWLRPAKLDFACSADYIRCIPSLTLTEQQREFLARIPDLLFRETVLDIMTNSSGRREYWIKGGRRLSLLEQAQALRQEQVVLVVPRYDITLDLKTHRVTASLDAAIYAPLLDTLADHQPRSLADIEQHLAGILTLPQVKEAVMVLVGKGVLKPAQDEAVSALCRPATDRLNAQLLDFACGHGEVAYLASPLTGGGIPVSRTSQLFLWAAGQGGCTTAEDCAALAWQILSIQGQSVQKGGVSLPTAEENLAALTEQARAFVAKEYPVLLALQVIGATPSEDAPAYVIAPD